jgi:hypothetical protein
MMQMKPYDIDDPETWQAYVDDAMEAPERARLEAAMAADPALAARVAAAARVRDRVRADFDAALDEPLPERFAALLSAPVPASSADTASATTPLRLSASSSPADNVRSFPARPRWFAGSGWAVAAAASLAIMVGGWWWRVSVAPIRGDGANRFAGGALAQALERSLAAETDRDAVAIGLTFRDRDAQWCRSFAMPGERLAGVACREDDRWRIVSLESGSISEDGGLVRQAASAMPPAVLQAIDARIEGDPLDATAERVARDAGWR